MQSSDIDFETKKEQLTRDLYITGTAYYKINKTKNNESFTIEVLNPLHTFIDRNPNSVYLKDSYRSVIRRYMHKNEILSKYGHLMSNEAISKIKECNTGKETVGNTYYMRAQDLDGNPTTNGIVAGLEVFPGLPSAKSEMSYNNRLLEVLEVEWLEVEKENGEFITYRYEGIRINGCIYIPIGKDNDSIRSVNDSSKTNISVNGLFFSDRNSQPFSLVLATANLQD